jgi:hypothetical protein
MTRFVNAWVRKGNERSPESNRPKMRLRRIPGFEKYHAVSL